MTSMPMGGAGPGAGIESPNGGFNGGGPGTRGVSAATAETIKRQSAPLAALIHRVHETVVGQDEMVRGLLIGLLTGGHVLLEGVPGLAKTLTISALAKAIDASFKRIQFTPDLLPADLVGTLIYDPRNATFTPRKGPIFAHLVLADEINRAPAKVQSALLEAMQERRVTIGDDTYALPDPFLVLATQNPIEQEGTYPLPEAQVDRFMLKVTVGYPTKQQERQILDRMARTSGTFGPAGGSASKPALQIPDLLEARRLVDGVHIDDRVRDYIVELVHATRTPDAMGLGGAAPGRAPAPGKDSVRRGREQATASPAEKLVEFGGSPRATISLALASKAHAFLEGRAFVTPHDVKSVAPLVLRHRVILSYEAEARDLRPDDVVRWILDRVPTP
ncbi:MAG TPA: MoxR family ATPase [Phycisphaerales bacterium]|nr:MoxR family ATPase [Phycisphaerales bacterium]